MKKYCYTASHYLQLALLFYGIPIFAQWSSDPNVNNPICIAEYDQINPAIVDDGSGGAIIAFEYQHSSGTNPDIYAQRIDANGIIRWTVNGVPISEAANGQSFPAIASDGAGGAIITWYDGRNDAQNPDIYAQRIDSNGVVQWAADGVAICTASYGQLNPLIVSDGTGGAFIAWEDSRNFSFSGIYIQHIDANGIAQWVNDGIAICPVGSNQSYLSFISDGSGGAILSWRDTRFINGIYGQRVNANGDLLWTTNGILITTIAGTPVSVSDGSGGVIIAWSNADIYAQRINSFGDTVWTANGKVICSAANQQIGQSITGDGTGGAIISWQDMRNSNYDIYAQCITSGGTVQWTTDGIAISQASDYQQGPQSISDNTGGAIITWYDYRNGSTSDIYVQRVDGNGIVQWLTDGVPVSTPAYAQVDPRIIEDGISGAIITWPDFRNSYDYNIYAQNINADGSLGNVTTISQEETLPVGFELSQNYPNPFNPSTTITFSIPQEEFVSLKIYNSLGEEISNLVNETKPAGNYSVSFDAGGLTSGIYFYKILAGSFFQTRKMMLVK